jgi:hypothetical protein
MCKFYCSTLAACLVCSFYSCQKDNFAKVNSGNSVNINPDNSVNVKPINSVNSKFDNSSSLIVGKWLINKRRLSIYTLSGILVKDTTITFTNESDFAWYEICNKDGNAYITGLPYKKEGATDTYTDTIYRTTYNISGNKMALYAIDDHSLFKSYTILLLSLTQMECERQSFGWSLDLNTQYKFVSHLYYTRQ